MTSWRTSLSERPLNSVLRKFSACCSSAAAYGSLGSITLCEMWPPLETSTTRTRPASSGTKSTCSKLARVAGTIANPICCEAREISCASQQIGFAMVPATLASFEHVDFVPLDAGRVLVVLVSSGGHISHKVIEPNEPYAAAELQQAENFLNTEFRGRSLSEVRQLVIDRLHEERTLYDELMARALWLASRTFDGLERQPSI